MDDYLDALNKLLGNDSEINDLMSKYDAIEQAVSNAEKKDGPPKPVFEAEKPEPELEVPNLDEFKEVQTSKAEEPTPVVEESVPEGYTVSGSPANNGGTITNTHDIETVNVTVIKVWDDKNDVTKKRPATLELTLNGVPEGYTAPTPTITKSEDGNSWTYTWTGVPKNDKGEEIAYTITEETVPEGYTCATTTVDAGGTITNERALGNLTITKTIKGLPDGKAPEDLSFTITGPESYSETIKYADFEKVPVDASIAMDDGLMDLIEPYNYKELEQHQDKYMSGFLAEKYNMGERELTPRAVTKVMKDSKAMMEATVTGYATVTNVHENINPIKKAVDYALLPVWEYIYSYQGKEYKYHVNGQTGKVLGVTPVAKGKVVAYGVTVFVLTMLAGFLIRGMLL